MPFGIGLPDIIEEPLNRIPGLERHIETDEEKRRREARERRRRKARPPVPKTTKPKKKEKKEEEEEEPKFGLGLTDLLVPGRALAKTARAAERGLKTVGAPKIVRGAVGDIAELGEGVIPLAGTVGRSTWHDLKRLPRHHEVGTDDLKEYLDLARWTYSEGYKKGKPAPRTGSELVGLATQMLVGWGRGITKAIPNPTDPDDVREAARTWRDDPVFALLDLIPVGAAATRPISVGKHAAQIGRANQLTGAQALRAGIEESYHPGAARRAGREGGIEPRRLRVEVGKEVREVAGRPYSRIPLMRQGQRYYDQALARSSRVQEKRVGRVEERAAREDMRRVKLEAQELSAPIGRLVYGRVGRMIGAFATRHQMKPHERARARALTTLFQMPVHYADDAESMERALAAVQADKEAILRSGKVESVSSGGRVKQMNLSQSDKQALTIEIDDLKRARDEILSGDVSAEEMRTALESMQEVADRTEEMGLSIMRDFRKLGPEELEELMQAYRNRASIIPRRLSSRGLLGLGLENSPERTARIAEWTERYGPDQAQALTAIYDSVARRLADDPADFYAQRVGMPTAETAEEFLARAGEARFQLAPDRWTHGERQLIEGRAEAPAGHSIFYSPVQKWVDENMPERMQVGQLRSELRKAGVSEEEYHNLGLDMWFDTMDPKTVISSQEFLNHLASPLNAYNMREIHMMNTREADYEGLATLYDLEHQGNYVSRDPAMGEYHEVVFQLPGPVRDSTYRGKADMYHWSRENVAVHFRFHVFTEDGKTKLLLEELQSDWGNDFRAAELRPSPDLTPEERYEFDQLHEEWVEKDTNLFQLRERLGTEPEGSALSRVGPEMMKDLQADVSRLTSQMRGMNSGKTPAFPLPPLGRGTSARSSYINSPIRWLHRYAAENGVDEIIVVDRSTQLIRNARTMTPSEWQNFKGGPAEDVTAWLDERGPHPNRSFISYETDIPNRFADELGVQGERITDAYEGTYRTPTDPGGDGLEVTGRMPGTVFRMTDEARARAMRSRSMYQRSPDWKALPKGAMEYLEGGRTRVHAFKDGDVSTWIHELGHIAVHDLPDVDRAILETHYAGGRVLDEWKDMEHESFARDFENYVRRGKVPSKQLAAVFARLSAWVKEIWKAERRHGTKLPEEVEEVFGRMFSAPEGDLDVWGYLPHRDFTALAQQEYRGGVRPPAAGQTLGVPRLTGETIQRNPNELMLYQTGRLSPDPVQLMDVFLRRLRFQETLNARNELWEMGESMPPQPPRGAWLIRNPAEAAERIRPEVQAAVRGQPTTYPLDDAERQLVGEADEIRKEMIARPGEHPEWATDMENVRWVPGSYVEARFGEVFEQRPRGQMWSALGMLNSLQRMTGIYGRPISYVGGNIPFNTMALLSSMPVSSLRNAGRTMRIGKRNPELYRKIASETGETRASGGLPEFYVRAQNRMQEAEQRTTQAQRAMADVLSKAADTPFRVTAFLNNARKRGFKTDEDLLDLIEDGGQELSDIRQLTREQLLDFDALNPSQRRLASQFLYLWPFIYASVKWPAMFAREYPARAALAAEGTQEFGGDEPQAIANLWKEHGVDLSTLNPVGPLGEIAEQMGAFLDDPTQMNLEFLRERLSPTLSFLVEGMAGGKKNALQNYVRQTVPFAAEIMSADPRFRGGKQFSDQSAKGYLYQRHLRFWPRGVNPEVIRERVEQFQKDKITADTHELEKNKDWEKISDYYKQAGGDADEIRRSYTAWWQYQEAVDEKKDTTGQRKLTSLQTIEILTEIAEEHFPEIEGELWDVTRMKDADYQRQHAKAMDDYAEALKKYINQGRTQLFNDYRSYASP